MEVNYIEMDYQKAYDHIRKVDAWDEDLWYLFYEKSGFEFCGNAKEFNTTFKIGLRLAIDEPKKFAIWNAGFIGGTSYGIDTIADWYLENLDEEDS